LFETIPPAPTSQAHLDETVEAVAQLQADHDSSGAGRHRAVERVTSLLGGPGFIVSLTLFTAAWTGLNGIASATGHHAWDSPPFPWLAGLTSMASLYIGVVILTTQRRDDLLARHRELLTLELAIIAEQKGGQDDCADRRVASR
jgi:uncharacterized membrane protein